MQPGPAEPTESVDLAERLGRLVSTVDDSARAQMDRGQALVLALTDQLAAGQTETLYSLQAAASTVRDRAATLTRLAEDLPVDIAARVTTLVQELADAASAQITQTLDEASTRLGVALKSVQRDLSRHQEEYLGALRDGADSTSSRLLEQQDAYLAALRETAGSANSQQQEQQDSYLSTLRETADQLTAQVQEHQDRYLSALKTSAEATGTQLSDELEQAAKTIVDSAARAKASQTAVRAAAVAAVETLETAGQVTAERLAALQDQLVEFVDQASAGMESSATAFAEDSQAMTQGMTAVTESFIGRLFEVLDDRDERDRVLEERLNARVERLTQRTSDRMTDLATTLEQQITRLEARDVAERATTAEDLHELVVRLLAEPRGKLRDLRSSARQTAAAPPATVRPSPPASIIEVVLEDPWAEEQEVAPQPAKRAKAKAPVTKKPAPRTAATAPVKAPKKAAATTPNKAVRKTTTTATKSPAPRKRPTKKEGS